MLTYQQFQETCQKSMPPQYRLEFSNDEETCFKCYVFREGRYFYPEMKISYQEGDYGARWLSEYERCDSLYGCISLIRKEWIKKLEAIRNKLDDFCNHAEGKS